MGTGRDRDRKETENLEKKKLDAGTEGQLLEFRDLLVFAD